MPWKLTPCAAVSVASQRQISEDNFDEAVAGVELDRSFGAIRLDMFDSRGEIDRAARSGLRQGIIGWLRDGRRHGRAPPASEASGPTPQSTNSFCLSPRAFATPAPYARSARVQLSTCRCLMCRLASPIARAVFSNSTWRRAAVIFRHRVP